MDSIPNETLDQLVATAKALHARWQDLATEAKAAEQIAAMATNQAAHHRTNEIRARVAMVRVVQAIDRLAVGGATANGLDDMPLPNVNALHHTGESRLEDPCPTLRQRQRERALAEQAVA